MDKSDSNENLAQMWYFQKFSYSIKNFEVAESFAEIYSYKFFNSYSFNSLAVNFYIRRWTYTYKWQNLCVLL